MNTHQMAFDTKAYYHPNF